MSTVQQGIRDLRAAVHALAWFYRFQADRTAQQRNTQRRQPLLLLRSYGYTLLVIPMLEMENRDTGKVVVGAGRLEVAKA